MPEILRVCGHVPVILCACQVDMRYLYNDPTYLELGNEAFLRRLNADDIVLPEEAKQVAKRLGLYYYETSVLVQYGIDEVFSNCVRAALILKRRGKILVGFGNLKNVVRPHLQVPHMPPRPPPPKVVPYEKDDVMQGDGAMLDDSFFADVVFIVQRRRIEAHRVYLVAANTAFQSFFEETLCVDVLAAENEKLKSISVECALNLPSVGSRSCSQETLKDGSFAQMSFELHNLKRTALSLTNDTIYDGSDRDTGIGEGDSRGCSSRCLSQDSDGLPKDVFVLARGQSGRQRSVSARQYHPLNMTLARFPGSASVSFGQLVDYDSMTDAEEDSGYLTRTPTVSSSCMSSAFVCRSVERGENLEKVVISVDESISHVQFRMVLHYLYTGEMPEDLSEEALLDLQRVTRLLGIEDMNVQIGNMLRGESFLNLDRKRKFQKEKSDRLYAIMLHQNYLSDVTFELDDGTVTGHRALLAARCEMFSTMFTANFAERSTGVATFPGVSKDAFLGVLEYLYTGRCPTKCLDWIGLIELSNRLFLKDLLLSAELAIIKELAAAMENGSDVVESALAMLGPARLHGANQLAEWCTWILKVNYKDLIENNAKALESFDADLQADLARNRWPPLWYLKEVAIYEKAILEMNKERPQQSWLRRSDGEACISPGGCLSFWKKKK